MHLISLKQKRFYDIKAIFYEDWRVFIFAEKVFLKLLPNDAKVKFAVHNNSKQTPGKTATKRNNYITYKTIV